MAPPRARPSKMSKSKHINDAPSPKPSGKSAKVEATVGARPVPAPTEPQSLLANTAFAEEVEFPRGGTGALSSSINSVTGGTKSSKRSREGETEESDLFADDGGIHSEDESNEDVQKPAKRAKVGNGKSVGKASGKRKDGEKTKSAPAHFALSVGHLPTGLRVIGVVKDINDIDVVVSLPNNITAYLPITNVSEAVSKKAEEVANILEKEEDAVSEDEDELAAGSDENAASENEGSENGQDGDAVEDDTELDDEKSEDQDSIMELDELLSCRVTEVETATKSLVKPGTSPGAVRQAKRVEVTVDPRSVNEAVEVVEGMILPCVLLSHEDTGLLLEPHVAPFRSAFCPLSSARKYIAHVNSCRGLSVDAELEPGQIVMCVLSTIDRDRGLITVTLDTEFMVSALVGVPETTKVKVKGGSKPKTKSTPASFDSLTPLSATKVTVTRHVRDSAGAVVAVGVKLGEIEGILGGVHMGLEGAGDDGWDSEASEELPVGKQVQVRTLYSDPASRRVVFTRQPSLLSLTDTPLVTPPALGITPISEKLDIGSYVTFRSAVVDKNGIFGKVVTVGKDGQSKVGVDSWAYIHISRLSDTHTAPTIQTDARYATGTIHQARIVGVDMCDRIWQCSSQKSVMETKFLRIADVMVGEVVKAKVLKHGSFGMVVGLTDSITGLVQASHVSDVRLKNPEKLHKVGSTVKCRVLLVDAQSKKIQLTCRKSLVGMAFPPLKSYDEAIPGAVHFGVVTAVKEYGCLVTFFGGVRALVPIPEMSDGFIEKASSIASVGQVVKCRILTVDAASEKLRCSFKMAERVGNVLGTVDVGQIVDGRVVSVTADGVLVHLLSASEDSTPTKAFIPTFHLSDYPTLAQRLSDKLRDGALLRNLVVVSKDDVKGKVVASKKFLLREYLNKNLLPIRAEEFETNRLVPGWVKNVTEMGVFVGFLGGTVGLARKHDLADHFVTEIKDQFRIGQTVLARVTEVDIERRRFFVTLKASLCLSAEEQFPLTKDNYVKSSAQSFPFAYLSTYFDEKDELDFGKFGAEGVVVDSDAKWRDAFRIGQVVDGTIKQIKPHGVIVKLTERVGGVIAGDLLKGKEPELTRLYDAAIEIVKQEYCVVRVPALGDQITFAAVRHYNSGAGVHPKYRSGQALQVQFINDLSDNRILSANRRVGVIVADNKKKSPSPAERPVKLTREVKEPIDKKIQTLDDFKIGMLTRARVKSVKSTQVDLILAANLKGRLHCTEIFGSYEEVADPKHPFSTFKPGDDIECKVVGVNNSKNQKNLSMTHKTPTSQPIIEMTVRKADLACGDGELGSTRPYLSVSDTPVGAKCLGFVQRIDKDAILVLISSAVLGRITSLEASDNLEVIKDLAKYFVVGMAVNCWVTHKDDEKGTVELSLKGPPGNLVNTATVGRVLSVEENKYVNVVLGVGKRLLGRAAITDLSDSYESNPTKKFAVGEYVRCHILGLHERDGRTLVNVSLRESRVSPRMGQVVRDAELESTADLSVGMVVRGYVKNIADGGCFVSLGRTLTGRVQIKELSDDYVKDWKSLVKIGQLVQVEVIGVDAARNHVELTMKQSVVDPEAYKKSKRRLDFEDLTKGMKLDGTIRRVESFGVFINITGTTLSGLCHISEVSDKPPKDLSSLYNIGDPVKVIVLKVNQENKKLSLGLKPSYFDAEDFETPPEASLQAKTVMQEQTNDQSSSIVRSTHHVNDVEMEDAPSNPATLLPAKGISVNPIWDPAAALATIGAGAGYGSDDESSDGEDGATPVEKTKKSRKQRLQERKEEEKRIDQREKSLLDPSTAPQVAADFERLLLESPNDSLIWIKYMAFHMQMAEIDRARQTAERAIRTINYREEHEKLNVWIALMNLESAFGTAESLKAVFERAVQYNDPLKVYKQMVQIYQKSGKKDMVESTYQAMVKKFSTNAKVWQAFGQFYLQNGEPEKARELLQRSQKSLPKRDHVDNIAAFGQLEFKFGEPERGRTIFEGVLGNYPKRVDLWSVYLDMEISRVGDVDTIRRLFERVIHMKFSSKKMKFLFTRYLDFEKKHGTEETVQHVKGEAMRYVESITPEGPAGTPTDQHEGEGDDEEE
ncbi:rRNA biogenesis protein rrp5 [Gonapodya sp. JEL0774]|nr:rRNA biogenesis protein rrp5 [Gonapodya sp. JEL0774]